MEQISKEMINDYILAMKALIYDYEHVLEKRNIRALMIIIEKGCSLCRVSKKPGCGCCPWRLITGATCFSNNKSNFYLIHEVVENCYNAYKRGEDYKIPSEVYENIRNRIKELEDWIPLYSQKVEEFNKNKEIIC